MNHFSWARVGRLLRYDWVIDRSRYRTTLIIIGVIYVALMLTTFCTNEDVLRSLFDLSVGGSGRTLVPAIGMVGSYVANYFHYAAYVMVIVATVALHRKFTQPQTATSYLALPGTRLEKATAQCLHYAAALAALGALYLVAFYVTMLVGQLRYPEVGMWLATNPLEPVSWDDFAEGLTVGMSVSAEGDAAGPAAVHGFLAAFPTALLRLLTLAQWMAPFSMVLGIALYASVNMCFRHNGQLKTIALAVAAYLVLVLLGICGTVAVVVACRDYAVQHGISYDQALYDVARAVYFTLCVLLWLTPLLAAGAVALFFRQVARRQAK